MLGVKLLLTATANNLYAVVLSHRLQSHSPRSGIIHMVWIFAFLVRNTDSSCGDGHPHKPNFALTLININLKNHCKFTYSL